MFEEIFKYKSVNIKKLEKFGFQKKDKDFIFVTNILNEDFSLKVFIDKNGNVSTQVFDNGSGDEYGLYLMQNAEGEFVGQVREAVRQVLQKICDNCFEHNVFKSKQAKEIIEFVNKNYGDQLEFLWEKFPDTAILRRKDNRKWYAVLFVMAKSKLHVQSEQVLDIIDLRIQPEKLPTLIDGQSIFEGYHMNKKHWITICLDESVPTQKVLDFVKNSYDLAKK